MANVVQSGFGPIILNIKAQLVSKTNIPVNRVLIIGRRTKPPTFNMPQDLLLQASPPTPLPEWQSGSGRVADPMFRTLTVYVRVRNTLDSSDRDEIFLTDPSTGVYALEESVFNALEMYQPTDANGNIIVWQPMRLVLPNEGENRSEIDPAWGQSALSFSILYAPPLDQSVQ